MATLAKVTQALAESRGPDVAYRIFVPSDWLEAGVRLDVTLPRRLACAHCEGGGCDRCARSGAVVLRQSDEEPELVEVALAAGRPETAQLLRIPDHGGPGAGPALPRGCLMLRVEAGELSAGVGRADAEDDSQAGLPTSIWIWLALPVALVLMWWLIAP